MHSSRRAWPLLLAVVVGCSSDSKNESPPVQENVTPQVAPSCTDNTKNAGETDVDCGGGVCPACATGKQCSAPADCSIQSCIGLICQAPSCTNGAKGERESDVDCGGNDCQKCGDGKACAQATDCASAFCASSGFCAAPSCSDGAKNGPETDVDCGGACGACDVGKTCAQAADCKMKVCTSGLCQAETCVDGTLNGTETDLDCGGGSCAGCAVALACTLPRDCVSGVCSGSKCQPGACNDGVKNGSETGVDCGGTCEACPPPDPSTVAPVIDKTVATRMGDAVKFLYSGLDPIQTGVVDGVIDPQRVAVIRGKVMAANGTPIANVGISVLDHSEFGKTRSRADGKFDLVVNGGGPLTVRYDRGGFVGSQREVATRWQEWSLVPDVVLVAYDGKVTTVDFSAPVEVARQNPVTDASGTRQATLLFAQGTTASMKLPDGTSTPLTSLNVRATEFTVGANGLAAMPGTLPKSSAYTYALEMSVDEAVAAGATSVEFSQPVVFHVENFLGFAVGESVPTGYYDRKRGAWVASQDGRVIKVVSLTGGKADLDTDGDGAIDDATKLAALGVVDAEREKLATLYVAGTTLWRVGVTHFTPWDMNWPFAPPDDAEPPPPIDEDEEDEEECCEASGSVITVQNRTLGESIPIAGTSYALHYSSERALGSNTLSIKVTGPSVPISLKKVVVTIEVGGQFVNRTFAPTANQTFEFVWDGLDGFGRPIVGKQVADIAIGYVYDFVYQKSDATFYRAFGRLGEAKLGAVRGREEFTVWQQARKTLGQLDMLAGTLGGWTLSPHHRFDPRTGRLYEGDGRSRPGVPQDVPVHFSTNRDPTQPFPVLATLHQRTYLGSVYPALKGVVVGADGTVYFADTTFHEVYKMSPGQAPVRIAGKGNATNTGDGGLAVNATIDSPWGVALGPDGSLYVQSRMGHRIRKIDPNGIISTIAGTGYSAPEGDGGLATAAAFSSNVYDLAIAPDGTLYFADASYCSVRRIGTDGYITRFAGLGGGSCAAGVDGVLATKSALDAPRGVAVGPDGSVYVTESGRIRRITPDGIIRTVAGTGSVGSSGDGGPALAAQISVGRITVAHDGTLFFTDNCRIRRIATSGIIDTVVGSASCAGVVRDGVSGLASPLPSPTDVAIGPDQDLYFTHSSGLRVLTSRPRATSVFLSGGTVPVIPSRDGSELHVISNDGRHGLTLLASTGQTSLSLAYNSNGQVSALTDAHGNVTSVQYASGGAPASITAPGGQKTVLAVDANGYLAQVTRPGGASWTLTTSNVGRLAKLVDVAGGVHEYTYDEAGRLEKDVDPSGNFVTLASAIASPKIETTTMTTKLGAASAFRVERTGEFGQVRTDTGPTGAVKTLSLAADGSRVATFADGTLVTSSFVPDPRFGKNLELLSSQTVKLPSGLTSTFMLTRTTTTATNNRLLVTGDVDAYTIDGRAYATAYDGATRTITLQTPSGATGAVAFDAVGRVVSIAPPDVTQTTFTWDARGRLQSRLQGAASTSFEFDASHHVTARINGTGHKTRYEHDADDRLVKVTSAAGRVYELAYDARGNRTGVKMPSGGVHAQGYDAKGRMTSYTPAGGTGLSATYDGDGRMASLTHADGRVVTSTFDQAGRRMSHASPEATVAATYFPTSSDVQTLTRTPKPSGTSQSMTFGRYGHLVTSLAHGGVAQGSYAFTYDSRFLLTGVQLDATAMSPRTRDADGRVVTYGPFALARSGPGGSVSAISDSATSIWSVAYDALGRQKTRTLNLGSLSYSSSVTFDDARRLATKDETVAGTRYEYKYGYDDDGQLTTVERRLDAAGAFESYEAYAYDSNGNRTSRTFAGATEAATFDAQDRLVSLNAVAYTFGAAGFMTARGADSFAYGAKGELLSATVAGNTVTYDYDALGRRVARTQGGLTEQYLYAEATFRPAHSRASDGTLTEYFYDDAGRLFALVRNGAKYYVGTDYVGTPRIVVNASGAVSMSATYDAFGRLVGGDPTAFDLPIGFAGGLRDTVTGLVRFGLRDYDPAAGRWTARDPILFSGGQFNLYAYADNAPHALTDRSGLSAACEALKQLVEAEKKKGGKDAYSRDVLPWFSDGRLLGPIGDGNVTAGRGGKETADGIDFNYAETAYAASNQVSTSFAIAGNVAYTGLASIAHMINGMSLKNALNNFVENVNGTMLGAMAAQSGGFEAFMKANCPCE